MFVIFSPIVGEISFPFWLEHIFQTGWFNHQLDIHKVSTTSAASAASNASATSAVSVPGAKREYWQLFLLECVNWLLCNIEDDDDDDDDYDDYGWYVMSFHMWTMNRLSRYHFIKTQASHRQDMSQNMFCTFVMWFYKEMFVGMNCVTVCVCGCWDLLVKRCQRGGVISIYIHMYTSFVEGGNHIVMFLL